MKGPEGLTGEFYGFIKSRKRSIFVIDSYLNESVFKAVFFLLFRVLSPSFMFLCTTIASIFAYFRCNYSYSCSRENETLETIPLNNEGLSLVKIKFPMKNYRIVALNFTALQYISPQRSPKKTFNLRKFNFLKNLSSS